MRENGQEPKRSAKKTYQAPQANEIQSRGILMEIYCFLLGRHAIIKTKRGVALTTPLWTAPFKER